MKNLILLSLLLSFSAGIAQTKIPSKASQINTALVACPEMYQEGAAVLGYNQEGELITLRKGTNEMICLADDTHKDGISVACYSNQLGAYMARGRELIAAGKTEMEKREIRKAEIDAGDLEMPETPAAVYVANAKEEDRDFESGALKHHHIRYVLYKPYMTVEETGLPIKPGLPGMPWLMEANTHRSHIMITPPKDEK